MTLIRKTEALIEKISSKRPVDEISKGLFFITFKTRKSKKSQLKILWMKKIGAVADHY